MRGIEVIFQFENAMSSSNPVDFTVSEIHLAPSVEIFGKSNRDNLYFSIIEIYLKCHF